MTESQSESQSDIESGRHTNYDLFLNSILHVSVIDCKTEGEGLSQVITYLVKTILETNGRNSKPRVVRRRHHDFVWLHESLSNWSAGCILPPLPPKVVLSAFTLQSTKKYLQDLENFLVRVIRHPLLRSSSAVYDFLFLPSRADLGQVQGQSK